MNKTAVQQIVDRFNNKIQTLKKLRDENKDDKDVVFLCRSRISGFQEAASIAAEFLEVEMNEEEVVSSYRLYQIDFGNHLRCKIKVTDSGIDVEGAVNGWGDNVPLTDIIIS